MKRVCLNRLRGEAKKLTEVISVLEDSSALETLFDSIFQLCRS